VDSTGLEGGCQADFRIFSPFTVRSVDVGFVRIGLFHQVHQFVHARLAATVAVKTKFMLAVAGDHQHGGCGRTGNAHAGDVGVGGHGGIVRHGRGTVKRVFQIFLRPITGWKGLGGLGGFGVG